VIQPATSQAQPGSYLERLRTPWWWYLGAVGVSVLLGLEFAVAISGWIAWVPFAVLLPLTLLVVWRLSSGRLTITGGTLRAGDRNLDLSRVEQAIDLSATELRRLVGRHGDPLAYTFIRSWVGPGVQLVLRPPADQPMAEPVDGEPVDGEPVDEDTGQPLEDASGELAGPTDRYPEPYWLVSTRHPDRLLAAVRAAVETNFKPKGT
jgi:hypothetical protein